MDACSNRDPSVRRLGRLALNSVAGVLRDSFFHRAANETPTQVGKPLGQLQTYDAMYFLDRCSSERACPMPFSFNGIRRH